MESCFGLSNFWSAHSVPFAFGFSDCCSGSEFPFLSNFLDFVGLIFCSLTTFLCSISYRFFSIFMPELIFFPWVFLFFHTTVFRVLPSATRFLCLFFYRLIVQGFFFLCIRSFPCPFFFLFSFF